MAAQELPYWDTFRDTAIGKYLLDRERAFIAQHIEPIGKPFRLLEICSCTGRVTMPLRDSAGVVVTGVDIDFDALTMFQARPGNHPAVMASALELPFAPECFDGIVAIQCFRYFHPVEFMQACHRVLKADGWLILQVVNRLSYKRTLKRLAKHSSDRDANVFPVSHVLALLASQGFDVCSVRGYNWLPFTPRVTRMSNSRLIPYAARIESSLRLERLYHFSPWVLVAARRAG
jgi:SAM-dependent methyltransferase